jgi:CrcB protein
MRKQHKASLVFTLLPAQGAVMSFSSCLMVMLGGAIGSLARYLVSLWALPLSETLPFGTLLINATGSFAIGFFGTLTLSGGRFPVSENLRLFVMVGLCGGFTTFSAFSLQTLDLMRNGAAIRAAVNVAVSIALCVGAVAAGHAIAARFNHGATQIAQLPIEEEA